MGRGSIARTAIVALLVLLVGVSAAEARRRPSGLRIECNSLGDRYAYCRTHAIGRVRLERQLSKTRCREYETWGSDGDGSGVWVRNGCRGVFVVQPAGPRPGQHGGGVRSVTCTSRDYAYAHCDVPVWGRSVWVQRQLSDKRCVQGDNWGVDWRGIWVDRGCNAIFAVR